MATRRKKKAPEMRVTSEVLGPPVTESFFPEGPVSPTPGIFRELPARPHVDLEIDDPRWNATDYADFARAHSSKLKDAVVRVSVRLSDVSTFEPDKLARVLLEAGAVHVVPIVPTRPRPLSPAAEKVAARLPIPEAFSVWLDGRPLPRGVERELVAEEFRAILEAR